jgi:hypothetical protein
MLDPRLRGDDALRAHRSFHRAVGIRTNACDNGFAASEAKVVEQLAIIGGTNAPIRPIRAFSDQFGSPPLIVILNDVYHS